MKKKLVSLALVFFMCLSLVACTSSSSDETHQHQGEEVVEPEATGVMDATEVPEVSEEPENVTLSGKDLVEWFISEYNKIAPHPITDAVEVDVTDRESGHYRTEFRLSTFEGSYSQTGKIGDVIIDIVTYGWGRNEDIRIYTNEITLEQAKEIVKFASPLLDKTLLDSDIQEVLDYLDANKSANGYYYGEIGIVFIGELMLKVE